MLEYRALIALALLAGVACWESPTEPRRVPFETIYGYHYSGIITARTEVISSYERWVQVWREIHSRSSPEPPLPVVDFTTHSVLLAALGENADACWGIEIAAVEVRRRDARAFVRRTRSHPSCSCPPVAVQPVHVVRIPRPVTSATFSSEIVVGTTPCN